MQSCTLSNPQITPIYCVLVLPFSIRLDEHWVHDRKEHRRSPFLDVFATRNQSRSDDRMHIVGASHVVDVLDEVAR